MFQPARHTTHSTMNANGRVTLPIKQIDYILDNNLTVQIGQRGNKIHRLFYSHMDDMCFVVIQDVKNGGIITVLPIDYHENIAWKIPIEAQQMAEELIMNDEEYTKMFSVSDNNVEPKMYYIFGYIKEGDKIKVVSLDRYESKLELDQLVKDMDFLSAAWMATEKYKERTSLHVESTFVRFGRNGEAKSIHFN